MVGYPRTHLSYRFSSKVSATLGAALDRVMYKLARDNAASPDGYVEAFDVYTGLYLRVTPRKDLDLVLGLRYYTGRELHLYDRDGRGHVQYELDDGWGGVVKLEYCF